MSRQVAASTAPTKTASAVGAVPAATGVIMMERAKKITEQARSVKQARFLDGPVLRRNGAEQIRLVARLERGAHLPLCDE
jgi:hypothetical protein